MSTSETLKETQAKYDTDTAAKDAEIFKLKDEVILLLINL